MSRFSDKCDQTCWLATVLQSRSLSIFLLQSFMINRSNAEANLAETTLALQQQSAALLALLCRHPWTQGHSVCATVAVAQLDNRPIQPANFGRILYFQGVGKT